MQTIRIWPRLLQRLPASFAKLAFAILLTMGVVSGASARPYIFNSPFTAKPGDYISITGTGFGPTPRAFITPLNQAFRELQGVRGKDTSIVVQIPKNIPFTQYQIWVFDDNGALSEGVLINAPRGMHFDGPEVAARGALRIFGRNLYLGSGTPSASFVDAQTGATLSAQVNVSASDAYCLSLTAPGGLVAGRTYKVLVSNGRGSAYADETILARAAGSDTFSLGTPWGADFEPANPNSKYVFDVKNDPTLPLRAKGDGVTNDAPAIQAAIEIAKSIRGSIIYLPAGVYYLGGEQSGPGLLLRSNTVLYGEGVNATKLIYGPRSPKGSSYGFAGLSIQSGSHRVGLVGMSIQNLDKASQNVINLTTDSGDVSRIFLQQVNWDLGSGKGLNFKGDKIAIVNSNFKQAINRQFPTGNGHSGAGPLNLSSTTNVVFRGNTVSWASGEGLAANYVSNLIVENNRFTRSASDQIVAGAEQTTWPNTGGRPIRVGEVIQRGQGRQISVNFGADSVIQNNIFAVSDGVLKSNWDDGETILSEGGALEPRQDVGTVTAASGKTFTDGTRCSGCAWNAPPQTMVVLISGAGAGQWRNVTARNGNTFTIDKPWDVVPTAGSRFALSRPSYKNVIIRDNTMSNNPIGISLYDGSFLNVAIVGNNLTNNGGIYLRPAERMRAQWTTFGTYSNIEINNNVVTNANSYKPAYITVFFALADNKTSFWGRSVTGVEIRNNQVTGRPGTFPYPVEEGYGNYVIYQNATPYVESHEKPLVGTIFQDNACVNCALNYWISTGALDTVIWDPRTSNSSGAPSTFLDDRNIYLHTTTVKSVGTVIGND